MEVIIMIVIVVLLITALHYFPWRRILQGRELPRLIAYMVGVAVITLPVTYIYVLRYWAYYDIDALYDAGVLWLSIICGGVTLFILYLLDGWLNKRDIADEGAEREETLMRVINNGETNENSREKS